ncbi:MAG: transcription antitermination protein NusB [Cyanobacteria bacterium RI_101]|nr:transcription antitermination protein NusB [Cyanobacteria bacterium RI_101]
MSSRQQPRRVARELALLSLSQLKSAPEQLERQDFNALVLAAVRALRSEAQEFLETAAGEVNRANERLLSSETRSANADSARAMLQEALGLTQGAINRLGSALDWPETLQLAGQTDVREFALELIAAVHRRRSEIDQILEAALVDWQLSRLPRLDLDILRLAVAEIYFLEVPQKVAINEAVELAKRYSDDEGSRFINGVLRRVSNQRGNAPAPLPKP